ncbi:MAG TPA: helix-turn-helix domain-containing protein [Ilumatobacter sp.]|nr:helix-turn-helix domain-containing protein [Ilumatobacter sp.]
MSTLPVASSPARRAPPLPAEARRAAIIAAVSPLLLEHGAAVTTRQIAAAAGVSEGTIFNVFADKDELLSAALEVALDLAPFEQAISEIDASEPFERRLVLATELIQRRIVDIWKLVSQLGPHHKPADHKPLPDSRALTELFACDSTRLRIAAPDAARLLRALSLSLTHPLLTAEPLPAAAIVDLFLHGTECQIEGGS